VSLSATMLKLVNSAFYGMSRTITSLEKAIRILGFATVRNIALAAFVFDAFVSGKNAIDYRGFWLHSIAAASASDVLARRMRVKEIGEYFVYGLLHDLGIVVMMQYLPDELAAVKSRVLEGGTLGEAERDVIGCTHNELGAALAERWDFPESLVAVIEHHCMRELPGEFKRETAAVTCANAIVTALEIGAALHWKVNVVQDEVWELVGVAPDQLGGIMDEVLAELEHSRSFIELLYR